MIYKGKENESTGLRELTVAFDKPISNVTETTHQSITLQTCSHYPFFDVDCTIGKQVSCFYRIHRNKRF